MCRVLAYAGAPVLVDDLLFKPDSSLVRQAYAPQQLHMLNLGGFGLTAWDSDSRDPGRPFVYRSTELPLWDANLKSLSEKAYATCMLAHVRGIPYDPDANFGPQNLHPFHFKDSRWTMAHNGDVAGVDELRERLLPGMPRDIVAQMKGTTDSELVYALVMSELRALDSEQTVEGLVEALLSALRKMRVARDAANIDQSSSLNLFFADGDSLVATRFSFDYGCYRLDDPSRVHENSLRYLSLWYTAGERYENAGGEWRMHGDPTRVDSFLLASEPLTRDVTGWVEVPEYSALIVKRGGDGMSLFTLDLDV